MPRMRKIFVAEKGMSVREADAMYGAMAAGMRERRTHPKWTHLNERGEAHMVRLPDPRSKPLTLRTAVAQAIVVFGCSEPYRMVSRFAPGTEGPSRRGPSGVGASDVPNAELSPLDRYLARLEEPYEGSSLREVNDILGLRDDGLARDEAADSTSREIPRSDDEAWDPSTQPESQSGEVSAIRDDGDRLGPQTRPDTFVDQRRPRIERTNNNPNLRNVDGESMADGKGDVLAVARIAGIQAAKKASDLIPLCHNIPISGASVDILLIPPKRGPLFGHTRARGRGERVASPYPCGGLYILATVDTFGQTGVEMEALVAASVAGMTVYDMCKAVDRGMRITENRVVEKRGGRSGDWRMDKNGELVKVKRDKS